MTYATIESGLEDLIDAHADYAKSGSTQNVSKGDYRILGHGRRRAVVLQPGAVLSRNISGAPRRLHTLWVIHIELFIMYRGEISTIASDIRTDRQTLVDHLDKYPTLDGVAGVAHAFIASLDEPEVWPTGDSRHYWVQRIRMQVNEHTTITIAE